MGTELPCQQDIRLMPIVLRKIHTEYELDTV